MKEKAKKTRLDLLIDPEIERKFRIRFIQKKGDYSRKIEELMLKSVKRR